VDRRTVLRGGLAGTLAWIAGVASVAGVGRVAGQTSLPATPAGQVQDRVAETERAFADAMARRDFAAFTSFIAADAVFFGGEDAKVPMHGKQAVADAWKRFFDGAAAPFSWTPDMAEVLSSGTLGLTSGPVRNQKGELIGRFTSIWRLEPDGKWRIVFDKGSPAPCK